MSTPLTDLEIEALKLPLRERVRLADHLLASVCADPEVDEAWAAEVQRRMAAVEAGAPSSPPNPRLRELGKRWRESASHG